MRVMSDAAGLRVCLHITACAAEKAAKKAAAETDAPYKKTDKHQEESLKGVFGRFDTNKDSMLDADELENEYNLSKRLVMAALDMDGGW